LSSAAGAASPFSQKASAEAWVLARPLQLRHSAARRLKAFSPRRPLLQKLYISLSPEASGESGLVQANKY